MSDSTATVIGAMIIAPMMIPILGIVLGMVLGDGANLRRCLLLGQALWKPGGLADLGPSAIQAGPLGWRE